MLSAMKVVPIRYVSLQHTGFGIRAGVVCCTVFVVHEAHIICA